MGQTIPPWALYPYSSLPSFWCQHSLYPMSYWGPSSNKLTRSSLSTRLSTGKTRVFLRCLWFFFFFSAKPDSQSLWSWSGQTGRPGSSKPRFPMEMLKTKPNPNQDTARVTLQELWKIVKVLQQAEEYPVKTRTQLYTCQTLRKACGIFACLCFTPSPEQRGLALEKSAAQLLPSYWRQQGSPRWQHSHLSTDAWTTLFHLTWISGGKKQWVLLGNAGGRLRLWTFGARNHG